MLWKSAFIGIKSHIFYIPSHFTIMWHLIWNLIVVTTLFRPWWTLVPNKMFYVCNGSIWGCQKEQNMNSYCYHSHCMFWWELWQPPLVIGHILVLATIVAVLAKSSMCNAMMACAVAEKWSYLIQRVVNGNKRTHEAVAATHSVTAWESVIYIEFCSAPLASLWSTCFFAYSSLAFIK